MQALFQCLGGAFLVEVIGGQGAWDMLVSAETYHSGVAMLTRVLRHQAPDCCVAVSEQAVKGLLQRRAVQDVGAMAVFVELLEYTDLEHVDGQVLNILQSHLKSEEVLLRRLAVSSLVTLSRRPKKAATLQGLLPEVTQRLQDGDCEVRTGALTVLGNVLRLPDRQTAGAIALQLLRTLLPLFENVRPRESGGLVSMPGGARVPGPGWRVPLRACPLAREFSSSLQGESHKHSSPHCGLGGAGLRSPPLPSLLLGVQLRARALHPPLQRCDGGCSQHPQKADEGGRAEEPDAPLLPPARQGAQRGSGGDF
ncbi:uncharacterized protein FN964_015934 [Alca torda]